jgi:hypothetical protein
MEPFVLLGDPSVDHVFMRVVLRCPQINLVPPVRFEGLLEDVLELGRHLGDLHARLLNFIRSLRLIRTHRGEHSARKSEKRCVKSLSRRSVWLERRTRIRQHR